ncbi:hypothetical protein Clacol_000712 [Clathrus columnatus]|uniref:Uncharacterized protein n=1 Tax=Clathrus columnatus TaxID=1419009 RepID=A0AAV5A3P6_9AGAM|nr:hypothetical protein Clacol_000712 [Clathrus columnatus]
MKLSFISLILSAGLAISQVSASPLRVVVVTHTEATVPAHIHMGQGNVASHKMQSIPVYNSLATATADMNRRPQRKGCLRHKAMQATNWLRVSFGLPPLDELEEKKNFVALPIGMVDGKIPHHGHHHHGGKFHIKHKSQSFIDRLTRALIMLGPWEGRAVAFVLGCGLGVLVRMLWVLTVVTVRTIRGRSEEDDVIDVVIFEEQEHLLPPPEYEQSEVPRDVKEKVEN